MKRVIFFHTFILFALGGQLDVWAKLPKSSGQQTYTQGICLEKERVPEYSFQKFFPRDQRSSRMLYRGYKEDRELVPAEFVLGALGDASQAFKTWSMTLYIKAFLGGSETILEMHLGRTNLGGWIERKRSCLTKIKSRRDREREAVLLAMELSDQVYANHELSGKLKGRYLIYSHPDSMDRVQRLGMFNGLGHPSESEVTSLIGRGEQVFSTIDPSIVDIYDPKYIFGFRESQSLRSIDLNRFNHQDNGHLYESPNDRDEFISPGYVPSRDFVALYDVSEDRSYLSLQSSDEKIVIVIGGDFRSLSLPLETAKSAITTLSSRKVYGIISFQPLDGAIAKELKKSFRIQRGEISKILRKVGRELKDGEPFPLYAFPRDVPPSTIAVTAATFGVSNVTEAAGKFCNGREMCDYKIAKKFMFPREKGDEAAEAAIPPVLAGGLPEDQASFKISWTCSGSAQSYSLTQDAPSLGRVLQLTCPQN